MEPYGNLLDKCRLKNQMLWLACTFCITNHVSGNSLHIAIILLDLHSGVIIEAICCNLKVETSISYDVASTYAYSPTYITEVFSILLMFKCINYCTFLIK